MNEDYWLKKLDYNAEGYQERIDEIKQMLVRKRGYFFEKPIDEAAIILLSGGMDSVTLIDLAIKNWNSRLVLLYFRRDARNDAWEEESVDFFHEFYKKRYPKNILELLKLDIQIPSRINKKHLDKTRKKIMGLPMRNATMWANATAQAIYLSGKYGETIRTLIVGSVPEDRDSPESGYLSVVSQSIHACICLGDWGFQFNAPLMDGSFKKNGYSKKDLVLYCQENGIPLEKSRSCFSGEETPCGNCLACENRIRAFQEMEGN